MIYQFKIGEYYQKTIKMRCELTMAFFKSVTALVVTDVELSRGFYETVLGCKVENGIIYREDSSLYLKLMQAEKLEDVRPIRNLSNVLCLVENLETLYELFLEFKGNGALFAFYPREKVIDHMRIKEFAVRDLDGYLIGFGLKIGER